MAWDKYFMEIAKQVSTKSKDPSTKVGAVITDPDNRILSTGYNGWVSGCDEDQMTNERPLKYNLVCHAEMNALLYARRDLRNCIIYCTHAPCDNCLKHILQSGIRCIIFENTDHMERYDQNTLEAIQRLVWATDAYCRTIKGKCITKIIKEIKERA